MKSEPTSICGWSDATTESMCAAGLQAKSPLFGAGGQCPIIKPQRICSPGLGGLIAHGSIVNEAGEITNDPKINELAWREPRKGWGPLAFV